MTEVIPPAAEVVTATFPTHMPVVVPIMVIKDVETLKEPQKLFVDMAMVVTETGTKLKSGVPVNRLLLRRKVCKVAGRNFKDTIPERELDDTSIVTTEGGQFVRSNVP